MAPPACPSRNLWSARSAGFSPVHGGARCIPALPLPIYSGSGCVNPLRSPTHRHFSNVSSCLQHGVTCPQAPSAERKSLSGKKRAGGIHSTCPPRHCNRSFRHPFRVCIAPGTTRSAHTPSGLPCPGCVRPSPRLLGAAARSYLGHSHQSAAFEAPADNAGTGYHSGSRTPCAVIRVLHYSSHVGWTFMRPDLTGMSEAPAPA